MKRLFKILLFAGCGVLGLVLTAYMAFWLILEWDMRPRAYDINDQDFQRIAVEPLKSLACGLIPADIRIVRYFVQNNFNDGDELWKLEAQNNQAVIELVKQLKLKPAIPSEYVGRFRGVLDNKPTWVVRPHEQMKLLFVDDDQQSREIFKNCKFGIFYLWSTDGQQFFLYHIIT